MTTPGAQKTGAKKNSSYRDTRSRSLQRMVRRLGIGLRMVAIEWVDSHYRAGWTTEAAEKLPLKCLSVGWLVEDGESAKVLSAHLTSEDHPQRCGDMTIPTAAIISMVEVIR